MKKVVIEEIVWFSKLDGANLYIIITLMKDINSEYVTSWWSLFVPHGKTMG